MADMRRLPSVALRLLAIFSALLYLTSADEFTNPASGTTDLSIHYTVGDKVVITWDSSLEAITLLVSHWNGGDVGALLSNVQNTGSYTWTIGKDDNIDDAAIESSPNFVLLIRDPTGADNSGISGWVDGQLSSPGFIIQSNNVVSSSSESSSSSSTSTSTSTSTATSTSSTTSSVSSITSSPSAVTTPPSSPSLTDAGGASITSAAPVPVKADSSGLSTGAKVGIGVAAAVGGLLLMGLGIFLGLRWARKTKTRRHPDRSHVDDGMVPTSGPYYPPPAPPQMGSLSKTSGYGFQPVSELPTTGPYSQGNRPIHELGGA
ncbi:hypothetical protein AYO21_01169 [Fonsecaea monophora]|uniref:Mid2 domain-containing protein n=1 Tax=Fonsecaea monophora TaxID=254056 RepID=A0A177FND2_9EURO|nr:hypothetical protein AYO21_01169 [Fonsecaea monophora]KAH0841597.1 hypothetical protein FOPE_06982 [Fonsecaea pedrosoi]OAG44679.1 hypothetical protein AYO21_01169 [Fonsecaea monophora]